MNWRACSRGLTYSAGDGFVVYFDPGSGKTHMLSEIAAWLLEELSRHPLSHEQLKKHILQQAENVSSAEIEKITSALIQELQSFDLIEAT